MAKHVATQSGLYFSLTNATICLGVDFFMFAIYFIRENCNKSIDIFSHHIKNLMELPVKIFLFLKTQKPQSCKHAVKGIFHCLLPSDLHLKKCYMMVKIFYVQWVISTYPAMWVMANTINAFSSSPKHVCNWQVKAKLQVYENTNNKLSEYFTVVSRS